eukprot:c2816_g1_i2.p2 GENE.c2816_g1_i2~~c2816_g1_i2.p2  ORF type:complete len:103 (+),score=19.81 c2816_g1_i2:495-803(+)
MTGAKEWITLGRLQDLNQNGHMHSRDKKKPGKQIEKKRDAPQSQWQSFSKKNKRVKKATVESIFKSPESEKGKVGVTNSGHEMTGKFDVRPKHSKTSFSRWE